MLNQNISLEMEVSNYWNSVCLIGLGNHSVNKLLPSLKNSYADNIFAVSSKKNKNSLINRIYPTLDEALKELNNNTVFVIATPPSTHFDLSKQLLTSGKDVLVEKPSFLKIDQFNILSELATKNKLVLAEMMMYFENEIVKKSFIRIKNNINSIKLIELSFTIPANPENTFRNEDFFENSVIADIGCYPIHFLSYLELPLEEFNLNKIKASNSRFIIYEIKNDNQLKVNIDFGVSGIYKNSLKVEFINHNFFEVSPFFYGLEGLRDQIFIENNIFDIKKKKESNCFQKIFDKSRENWLSNQNYRFSRMKNMIQLFERFSNDFEKS